MQSWSSHSLSRVTLRDQLLEDPRLYFFIKIKNLPALCPGVGFLAGGVPGTQGLGKSSWQVVASSVQVPPSVC